MRNRLLVLGAALAAFGASLFAGFHFDDYAIFSDSRFTGPLDWQAVWASAQPLTDLTFRLSYLIGGRDPFAYHLFSLAFELAAVALAYECLRLMLGERAGFAAALVFALHPLQAEAVNYVSARGELLAAVFGFTALLAWLRGWRWIAVPYFGLALAANEYWAALPVVMFLAAPGARARIWRQVPAAALGVLSVAAVNRLIYLARGAHDAHLWWKYLLGEGPALWRYLRLLVVPYGFTVDPYVRAPAVWVGALAWVAILAAVMCAWRWRGAGAETRAGQEAGLTGRPTRSADAPAWATWMLAGLALLLPSSSALPQRDLYADSRMFLPMLAFAAAAGLLLARVKTRALAASVAAVLLLLSVARTTVWMSDKWLWQEAVRRAPEKARPKIQLSRSLPATDALEMLERAAVADPHDPAIPAEMGKVLLQEQQVDPALIQFGQALALDPNNAEYYNDRGVALVMSGWTERARADFERALEIDPHLAEATENLKKLPPAN